jgi:hypothetical protein
MYIKSIIQNSFAMISIKTFYFEGIWTHLSEIEFLDEGMKRENGFTHILLVCMHSMTYVKYPSW